MTPFIVIGDKGTALPKDLKTLEEVKNEGLKLGENRVWWKQGDRSAGARKILPWLANGNEMRTIHLLLLKEALEKEIIRAFAPVTWPREGGREFIGTAYVKSDCDPLVDLPQYIAVDCPEWRHGVIETKRRSTTNPDLLVEKPNFSRAIQVGSLSASVMATQNGDVAVDVLAEIEKHKSEFEGEPETVRKALIAARLGQGVFRQHLIDQWDRKCCVTKCGEIKLLRASHIKPWRDSNNSQRLDKFNGLLLIPNLDAAFDVGLISFEDSGKILISSSLESTDCDILGIGDSMALHCVFDENKPYLKDHRTLYGFDGVRS